MQILLERDRYETIMESLSAATKNEIEASSVASSVTSPATESYIDNNDSSLSASSVMTCPQKSPHKHIRDYDDSDAALPSKKICVEPSSQPSTQNVSKQRRVGSRCYFQWPGNTPLYNSGIIDDVEKVANEKFFVVSIMSLIRLTFRIV